MQEVQRVEILKSSSLDKAHQYLVVTHPVVRTIPKGYLAHNDVVSEKTLREVVVRTDFGKIQARNKLVDSSL